MSVTDLLLQAKDKKAKELLLCVGHSPKIKLGFDWLLLRQDPLLLSEWKILLQTVLTAAQKEILEKQGRFSNEQVFSGQRIWTSFFDTDTTAKAHLVFVDQERGEVEQTLPPAILQSLSSSNGLYIFTGSENDYLDQTLAKCGEKVSQQKTLVGTVVSEHSFIRLKTGTGDYYYTNWDRVDDYIPESNWIICS
ncbi:MAG: hypothetical protein ACOYOK_00865, partial [Pseudobdellovibrionaceae bacterium]